MCIRDRQYTGWTAIIYLAAITGISSDLYEAAEMDGATRLQQIFHVTIPSIMPTIMVMLIMNVGRMLSIGYEKVLLDVYKRQPLKFGQMLSSPARRAPTPIGMLTLLK